MNACINCKFYEQREEGWFIFKEYFGYCTKYNYRFKRKEEEYSSRFNGFVSNGWKEETFKVCDNYQQTENQKEKIDLEKANFRTVLPPKK